MSFCSKSLLFTPASNLRVGFGIPIWNDKKQQYEIDEISTITSQLTQKKVYDIDIERTHNFVANDVIVHNSIYSWRGADMRNIINFKKDYPEAKIVKLEQNYRSTKHVIAAANTVIKNNKESLDKELWTDNPQGEKIFYAAAVSDTAEANFIAENIQEYVNTPILNPFPLEEKGAAASSLSSQERVRERCYSDNLILYRTNAQSR